MDYYLIGKHEAYPLKMSKLCHLIVEQMIIYILQTICSHIIHKKPCFYSYRHFLVANLKGAVKCLN